MRSWLWGCVAALAIGQAAFAQSAIRPFEIERLHPNPGGESSLINDTGELLPVGELRISSFGMYERSLLLLHENGTTPRLDLLNRATGDFMLAYAPIDWMQISFELPVVGYLRSNNLGPSGYLPLAKSGIGTPHVAARFGLLSTARGAPVNLAAELGFGVPVVNAGVLGTDDTATFDPRLSVGGQLGDLTLGGEVSGHIRPQRALSTVEGDLAESELRGGISGIYRIDPQWRVEVDVRGGYGLKSSNYEAEVLAGARFQVNRQLELFAVGGPGFGTLTGTPQARVLAGGALAFGDVGGSSAKAQPAAAGPVCEAGQPHRAADCPSLDDDGDGIANGIDNCPLLPEDKDGYMDQDGCPDPDNDGDGLADVVDKCPGEPGLHENNGCPVKVVADADKDGVPDGADKCPTVAGSKDNAGCPVVVVQAPPAVKDTDGDGLPDDQDNCVEQKGTAANHGCPAKNKQLVVITKEKLQILDKVYFAGSSAKLKARSHRLLNQIAYVIKDHPNLKVVEIDGFTDSRGSAEHNVKLSQARADAVRNYLVKRGVEPKRLVAKGYGEAKPIDTNFTAAGREANRRVEFNIPATETTTTQTVPATPPAKKPTSQRAPEEKSNDALGPVPLVPATIAPKKK